MDKERYKIVFLGGGTGMSSILKGVREIPIDYDVSAIVTMADDGGSSGRLRKRFKILPPGDVLKNSVSLSRFRFLIAPIFLYRFPEWVPRLRGHVIGNMIYAVLEILFGKSTRAAKLFNFLLWTRGDVVPVTNEYGHLYAKLMDGTTISNESIIDVAPLKNVEKIYIGPETRISEDARKKIESADLLVISAGDIYTSILPTLNVVGVKEAIEKNGSEVLYYCNLITKKEHTAGRSVEGHKKLIERLSGIKIDYIIFNNKYREGNIFIDNVDFIKKEVDVDHTFGFDLVNFDEIRTKNADVVRGYLARHDAHKSFNALMLFLSHKVGFNCLALDFDRTIAPVAKDINQLTIYNDMEFLLKEHKFPISIVTTEQGDNQKNKIKNMKIKYSDIYIVGEDKRKSKCLMDIMDKYGEPIVYMDDKVSTLLKIREDLKGRKVFLFQCLRKDSIYKETDKRIPYINGINRNIIKEWDERDKLFIYNKV